MLVGYQNCAPQKTGGKIDFKPPEGALKDTASFVDTFSGRMNLNAPPGSLAHCACPTNMKTCAVTLTGASGSGLALVYDQNSKPMANQTFTFCAKSTIESSFSKNNCAVFTSDNVGAISNNTGYVCVNQSGVSGSASIWIGNQSENPQAANWWKTLGTISTANCQVVTICGNP